MGKASTPTPPDPKDTSAAQTGTNIGTAIANNTMGQVNQVTPNGNLTYSQSGTTAYTDPYTGQTYQIPSYTATQTLSPTESAINTAQEGAKLSLAQVGQDQAAKLGSILNAPLDLSAANVAKYENTNMDPQLQAQWDQKQQQYGTQLSQQGVKLGSSAYDRAMSDFSNQRSNAESTNNAAQYQNAVASITQQQNQPLNQINALLSGSQVSTPSYVSTPTSSIATTDNAGIINSNYQQQVAAANAQNAQTGQTLGGLFGLAGNIASLFI